jgi:ABC-type multidrug transport system fused ATPase/permease subunit
MKKYKIRKITMKKTKKKINGGVLEILNFFKNTGNNVATLLRDIPQMPRTFKMFMGYIYRQIMETMPSAEDRNRFFSDTYNNIKNAIIGFFEGVGEGIKSAFFGIFTKIGEGVVSLYNFEKPYLEIATNGVSRLFNVILNQGFDFIEENIWPFIQQILMVILFVFASSGFIDLILYFLKSPFFLIPMILNTSKYISSTLMAIFVKILNAIGFHYSLPFFQVANQPYQAPPPQYQQPPPTLIKIDQPPPPPPPPPQPITIKIDPQQTAKAFDNEYLKESIKMMNNKVEQMTDFADKMTKNMFELLKQSNENKNIEVSELKQAFKKQSDDLVELTKKLNETTNKTDNISKIFNDSYNYIFDKMIEPTMNKLYNVLQNPAVQYIGTAIILIIALKYIYIVIVKIYKWIFNIKTETEEDKEIKKKVEHILEKNEKLKHKLEELMHENKNKMKKIEKKVLDKFTFEFKKAKNISKKGSKIGSKTKYSKTKSRTKSKGN